MTVEFSTLPPEVWQFERGHTFYPPKAELDAIPAIYATEGTPCEHKIVHLHYFASWGDWYVTEFDPNSGEAFGWARLGADDAIGEWGYIDLPALESHRSTLGQPHLVERELGFKPQMAAACLPEGRRRIRCKDDACAICLPPA